MLNIPLVCVTQFVLVTCHPFSWVNLIFNFHLVLYLDVYIVVELRTLAEAVSICGSEGFNTVSSAAPELPNQHEAPTGHKPAQYNCYKGAPASSVANQAPRPQWTSRGRRYDFRCLMVPCGSQKQIELIYFKMTL